MERLLELMKKIGYFKKQEDILRLFKHIKPNQEERTIYYFMEFIEWSERHYDTLSKCTGYVYELYGGIEARGEILRIFHERVYNVLETNKVLNLFGNIPFIVIEIQDLNLILKCAKQIAHDFKKIKI